MSDCEDYRHAGMLFIYSVAKGRLQWRSVRIRPCWFANLRSFLWWDDAGPPGRWHY